jgi:hypothetical protein
MMELSFPRMLPKAAGVVLASFPGIVRRETKVSLLARWGLVAEKSGLFEHPGEVFSYCASRVDPRSSRVQKLIFQRLLPDLDSRITG